MREPTGSATATCAAPRTLATCRTSSPRLPAPKIATRSPVLNSCGAGGTYRHGSRLAEGRDLQGKILGQASDRIGWYDHLVGEPAWRPGDAQYRRTGAQVDVTTSTGVALLAGQDRVDCHCLAQLQIPTLSHRGYTSAELVPGNNRILCEYQPTSDQRVVRSAHTCPVHTDPDLPGPGSGSGRSAIRTCRGPTTSSPRVNHNLPRGASSTRAIAGGVTGTELPHGDLGLGNLSTRSPS